MDNGARLEAVFNPIVKVELPSVAPVSVETNAVAIVDLSTAYTGSYVFAPSDEIQIIEIKNKKATDNITIDPIPSNYGHIDWNGSYLKVY